MEYKPYKIGDTLSSDCEDGEKDDLEVIDFSQNGKVIFTSGLYTNTQLNFYTRRELDDLGYKLKTTAKLEIPNKWVPKYDEEYFFIDDCGRLGWDDWNNSGSYAETFRLKTNNVFKTDAEAIKVRDKIMNQ